jgi:hypothetical protein
VKKSQQKKVPTYIVFSQIELLFLVLCVILDVSEYIVAILLLPVFGDILDIAGIFGSLLMFKWIGIISILELIPGVDILPIFIITWTMWYLTKKRKITIKNYKKIS